VVDLGIEGRAALVGGASKGLGRAVAEALAAEGCRLALWSRGGDALRAAAADIRRDHGVEAFAIEADARDPEAGSTVARRAAETLGAVDILVLNAGGPPTVDPTETTPDGWRDAFQLLAITPIALATELLPGMRDRAWGRIVGILSSGVRQPIPALVYSNAGRSALAAWMKTVATRIASEGVTVNGVLPGRLATDRTETLNLERAEHEGGPIDEVRREAIAAIPAGRYGRPDELGSMVAYLCSERAAYLTGALIPVDGGLLQAT
jgi:3-oxoacyl-[acyl-carrier protein] reductase